MWQIVLNGPGYLDTCYDLPEGETSLGRSEEMDVVLAGELVSRRHALLRVRDGALTVLDAGSRNGTLVNGVLVRDEMELAAGDRIEIGENHLEVRRQERDDTTVILRQEAGAALGRIRSARSITAGAALARGPEVTALVILHQMAERLASSCSLEGFLEAVASLVLELANAEGVAVELRGGNGRKPFVCSRRSGGTEGAVPVSRSVVAECVRSKVTLVVADATVDARFAGSESLALHGSSQAICVPLLREGEVDGVIYVTRQVDHTPLKPLVEAIETVAHLTAAGVEHQRLRERATAEEVARRRLERFLGSALAAELSRDLAAGEGPHMEEREATLLFADISGFTALTERLAASRVAQLLDEFYRRMARVIFAHGGTVDKFIGDEVMAIFGAPLSFADDAARALRAALAMREEFAAMMASWPEEDRCRLKVGLNTGRVLAGTVGGEERLEYTAVGDAVNVASRLVGEAEPGQILAGVSTVIAAGPRFVVRPLGVRQLRGRAGEVEIVEVLGEMAD